MENENLKKVLQKFPKTNKNRFKALSNFLVIILTIKTRIK